MMVISNVTYIIYQDHRISKYRYMMLSIFNFKYIQYLNLYICFLVICIYIYMRIFKFGTRICFQTPSHMRFFSNCAKIWQLSQPSSQRAKDGPWSWCDKMPDLPGAEVDVMLNPGSNCKWGALPETNPRGLESPNNKIKKIKSYSIHVRVFRDSPKENTLPETHSLHLKTDGKGRLSRLFFLISAYFHGWNASFRELCLRLVWTKSLVHRPFYPFTRWWIRFNKMWTVAPPSPSGTALKTVVAAMSSSELGGVMLEVREGFWVGKYTPSISSPETTSSAPKTPRLVGSQMGFFRVGQLTLPVAAEVLVFGSISSRKRKARYFTLKTLSECCIFLDDFQPLVFASWNIGHWNIFSESISFCKDTSIPYSVYSVGSPKRYMKNVKQWVTAPLETSWSHPFWYHIDEEPLTGSIWSYLAASAAGLHGKAHLPNCVTKIWAEDCWNSKLWCVEFMSRNSTHLVSVSWLSIGAKGSDVVKPHTPKKGREKGRFLLKPSQDSWD